MAEEKKKGWLKTFFEPPKLRLVSILKWGLLLWVTFTFLLPAVGGLKGAEKWMKRVQGALHSLFGETGTPPGGPGVVVDEGALVNYQSPVGSFDSAGNLSSLSFKGVRGKQLVDQPDSSGWVLSPVLPRQPGTFLVEGGLSLQLRFSPAVAKGTWLQGQVRVKSGRTTQTWTWNFQVPGDATPAVGPASGGNPPLTPGGVKKEEPQAPPQRRSRLREAGERWRNNR